MSFQAFVLLALIGVSSAFLFGNSRRDNYGSLVYGMGLNNPFAKPANPFEIRHARNIARRIPGTLVVSFIIINDS